MTPCFFDRCVPVLRAPPVRRWRRAAIWAAVWAAAGVLSAGCGGGGPLGNPPDIANDTQAGGSSLSFAYFQRCINPIFLKALPIVGTQSVNTCASAGCHDDANGTGGAFRVRPGAAAVVLAPASGPAPTAAEIQATDMYRNFYSAQGEVSFNAVTLSRLITKPLVRGVLHGGGLIFADEQDENLKLILFWMTHPVPAGQTAFSSDPGAGACPTQ